MRASLVCAQKEEGSMMGALHVAKNEEMELEMDKQVTTS
jgi:hypothetical protein